MVETQRTRGTCARPSALVQVAPFSLATREGSNMEGFRLSLNHARKYSSAAHFTLAITVGRQI